MKLASTIFVVMTVILAVVIFFLTVLGVVVPVPLRVVALAATAVAMALCMTAIANRGPL